MIVIADTGPINYLILIGEIELLPALYGHVTVPHAVCEELARQRAPESVRAWIAERPSWLNILTPTNSPDAGLAHLDAGERDAILLQKNWPQIRSSSTRFADGGKRRGAAFISPAPWACSRLAPIKDWLTSGARWTACVKRVSTFRLISWTD